MRSLLCLALSLLFGCVSLSKDYVEKRQYLFEAERPQDGSAGEALADALLSVRSFVSSPGLDEAGLLYRSGENRYQTDFYHELFVPPTEIVSDSVRGWMRDARLFRAVLEPGALAESNYVIDGCLTQLCGDYRSEPKAVIELQIFLTRFDPTGARVCMQRKYTESETLKKKDPELLVAGYGKALARVLETCEKDIRVFLEGG